MTQQGLDSCGQRCRERRGRTAPKRRGGGGSGTGGERRRRRRCDQALHPPRPLCQTRLTPGAARSLEATVPARWEVGARLRLHSTAPGRTAGVVLEMGMGDMVVRGRRASWLIANGCVSETEYF